MPQNPIMVYSTEDGQPTYMHTVDAAEAIRLGDYTPQPPDTDGPSPEERASAMSRFKTGQGVTHPEMQTEEEREKAREEANAKAELLAGIPEGAQVVVMAPSKPPRTGRPHPPSPEEPSHVPPPVSAPPPPAAPQASTPPPTPPPPETPPPRRSGSSGA
jgi:hypothetical protein